jgi:transcriptional regulator with XRE-family HTH domain
VNIGDRLRILREEKDLSQGDIEKRTGLLRCYISRVENGHTVPAVETLEKFARALESPLYYLMYDGDAPPRANPLGHSRSSETLWGGSGKDARSLVKLSRFLSKMDAGDRALLLAVARQMARKKTSAS